MHRSTTIWFSTATLAVLCVSGGATCRMQQPALDPLAPVVFPAPPSLGDLIYQINANTDRVRSLHSDVVTLRAPGAPGLHAVLSAEPPLRFRLRAKFLGPEVDVGSNHEHFWFWAKSSPEPMVLYASHAEFAHSSLRQQFPVDPTWIAEALGLVRLDPAGAHQGPTSIGPNRVQIQSALPTVHGNLTRVLVVDDRYGWILEQQLYDAAGMMVASAKCAAHRYDANSGASLPHQIDLEIPSTQLRLRMEVSQYQINMLPDATGELWTMPPFAGHRFINVATAPLANPASLPGPSPQTLPPPATVPPTATSPIQPAPFQPSPFQPAPAYRQSLRPMYRGYSTAR